MFDRGMEINGVYKALMELTHDGRKDKGWEKVGKIKDPLGLNLFLWFLRHNKLPFSQLLFDRKCSTTPTPICTICERAVETALHALRDCH